MYLPTPRKQEVFAWACAAACSRLGKVSRVGEAKNPAGTLRLFEVSREFLEDTTSTHNILHHGETTA